MRDLIDCRSLPGSVRLSWPGKLADYESAARNGAGHRRKTSSGLYVVQTNSPDALESVIESALAASPE